MLGTGQWFARISGPLREDLLATAQFRTLAADERLFCRGDAPDGIYALLEGMLRVSGTAESGKEALLVMLEPPNWFGEIALFDGGPRTHDAYAIGPSLLLQVPQQGLRAMLEAKPHYWRELAQLLTEKLRLTFVALEAMTLLPGPLRLAQRLVMIAEGYGAGRDRAQREIRIPQEQLAQMVSLTRQSANQILKDLEAQGIVRLTRGGVEIVDLVALRKFH